jgi:hypothetical protein
VALLAAAAAAADDDDDDEDGSTATGSATEATAESCVAACEARSGTAGADSTVAEVAEAVALAAT